MNLKKNIIYNSVYQVLTIILPLITVPYVARVIGAEGIGIYSYTYSIANYFGIFIFCGLQNYGCKSIAMHKDNRDETEETFWSIYFMQLLLCVIIGSIYFLFVFISNGKYRVYMLWQGVYVLSFGINISWFLQGIERFDITVKRNVIIKVFTLVLLFVFVRNQSDLLKYTILLAVSSFISQIIYWFTLKKYIHFYKPKISEVLIHVKPNLILFIPVLAVSVYQTMDKIMLGSMSDVVSVGYYENAEKILNVPIQIIGSIGTVLMPRITNLLRNNKNDVAELYLSYSYKFTMVASCAFSFGIAAVAPHFVPFFYGAGFDECITLIVILAPTVVLNAFGTLVRMQLLIPYGHEKIYIIAVSLGAVFNVIGNLLLIPICGAAGASVATVIAEAVVTLYQFAAVEKYVKLDTYANKKYLLFFLFGILMFACVRYIEQFTNASIMSLLVEVTVGALIYLLCSLGYFRICDINFIQNIKNS